MLKESRNSTLGIYAKVEVDNLDYCNAFVRSCYHKTDNGFRLTKRELVSYCTPVLAISYNGDGSILRLTCAQAATCSATTRKHVSRFLKKFTPSIGYYAVKIALNTPGDTYKNGLRVIEVPSFKIHERPDIMHVYNVLYESVKPFPTRF